MLFSRSRAVPLGGALVLAIGIALAVLSMPTGPAAPGDPAAARAVRALTSDAADHALTAVPGDFAAVEGYRPVVREGVLLRPDGSCSSPLRLPRGFTPFCDRHDLGYDLLRYAAAKGHPLGPWARAAIDRQLGVGLRAACARAGGAGCGLVADTAYAVVRVNSWRQGDRVPGSETPTTVGAVALGGVGALSLLVLALARLSDRVRLALRGRWRCRRRHDLICPQVSDKIVRLLRRGCRGTGTLTTPQALLIAACARGHVVPVPNQETLLTRLPAGSTPTPTSMAVWCAEDCTTRPTPGVGGRGRKAGARRGSVRPDRTSRTRTDLPGRASAQDQ